MIFVFSQAYAQKDSDSEEIPTQQPTPEVHKHFGPANIWSMDAIYNGVGLLEVTFLDKWGIKTGMSGLQLLLAKESR